MRRRTASILVCRAALAALSLLSLWATAAAAARLGQRVEDFSLVDGSGQTHTLSSYTSAGKVVVIDFWSFKCPVSLAYDERLSALQAKYRSRGVVVLGMASNANESAEEIRRNVANLKLSFPVLLDVDGLVAEALGATHTPHVLVIDRDNVLRYRGALDNNRPAGDSGRLAHAEEALDAILAGQRVPRQETRVFGCSIKQKPF